MDRGKHIPSKHREGGRPLYWLTGNVYNVLNSVRGGKWHPRCIRYACEDRHLKGENQKRRCVDAKVPSKHVMCLDFSRDGTKLVTADGDHTVKVFDFATGDFQHSLNGHRRTVWVVACHQTIPYLAVSGDIDGRVIAWNIDSGVKLQVFDDDQHIAIQSLSLHPTLFLVMVAQGFKVKLWRGRSSALTGEETQARPITASSAMAAAASGTRENTANTSEEDGPTELIVVDPPPGNDRPHAPGRRTMIPFVRFHPTRPWILVASQRSATVGGAPIVSQASGGPHLVSVKVRDPLSLFMWNIEDVSGIGRAPPPMWKTKALIIARTHLSCDISSCGRYIAYVKDEANTQCRLVVVRADADPLPEELEPEPALSYPESVRMRRAAAQKQPAGSLTANTPASAAGSSQPQQPAPPVRGAGRHAPTTNNAAGSSGEGGGAITKPYLGELVVDFGVGVNRVHNDACLMAVQFSASTRFVLCAYASCPRPSFSEWGGPSHVQVDIYSLTNKQRVSTITGSSELNCARFSSIIGGGIALGTRHGTVEIVEAIQREKPRPSAGDDANENPFDEAILHPPRLGRTLNFDEWPAY